MMQTILVTFLLPKQNRKFKQHLAAVEGEIVVVFETDVAAAVTILATITVAVALALAFAVTKAGEEQNEETTVCERMGHNVYGSSQVSV